jgi:16S rRNA (guanine(527)-N(7))-methyltransferase RsmG
LGRLLARLGLPPTTLSLLFAHASAVEANAARIGLVSPGDAGRVIERHTADSLLFALVRAPAADEAWIDVGSGAGFPGLVLAVCYPGATFTLLEPLKKRAGFLDVQVADLGLGNVAVDTRRLEQIEGAHHDVAVARALTDPGRALKSMVRVLRARGQAIVAVGEAAVPSDLTNVEIVSIEVPGHVDSPGHFLMMAREA